MLAVFAGIAIAVGLGMRLLPGWDRPFWFDEVFSGVIAMRPTPAGFVEDALRELSGPVYYGFLWAWEKLAGAGTVALRAPSAAFSAAAALLILWRGHPDRDVRLIWAALLALNVPTAYFSIDARPYSLLVLLATAQAILFMRLLRRPETGAAAAWALVSMLLVLTHYYTVPLVGAQGLLYLLICGKRALRTWPAALAFAPLAVWMPIHLPFLFAFASVGWQSRFLFEHLLHLPDDLLGLGPAAAMLVLLPLVTGLVPLAAAALKRRSLPIPVPDLAVILSGILGVLAIVGLALLSSTYAPRYLIPMIPALLLGLAVWAREWGRRLPALPLVVLALVAALSPWELQRLTADPARDVRYQVEWEDASRAFAAHGVRRMAFYWDEPANSVGAADMFARAGGFHLARQGYAVAAVPIMPRIGEAEIEQRRRIEAALDGSSSEGRDAFIWISRDRGALADRMRHFAPGFACSDYGTGQGFVVLGCISRAASPAA